MSRLMKWLRPGNSLRARVGVLYFAFFTLVLVSVVATTLIIETLKQDALIINLAGRQRMLIQQMTRLSLQVDIDSGSLDGEALQEAIDTFDRTLQALTYGGQAPYLPGQEVTLSASQDRESLAALDSVQRSWNSFRSQLAILVAGEASKADSLVATDAIRGIWPILLQQADDAVRVFETNSVQKVSRLRWIQGGFFITAILLLIIGFVQTRRSVMQPLDSLASAADRIGHGDLSTTVIVDGPSEIERLAWRLDEMRQQLHLATQDLEGRVARRTEELAALYEVSRDITSRLEIDHVLRSVTDRSRDLFRSETAFICLLNSESETLALHAMSGPEKAVQQLSTPALRQLPHQILGGDEAQLCGVADCGGVCGIISKDYRTSHLAAPLRIGDRVIGALCVSSSKPEAFDSEEIELLTKLANSAAIALENAKLYEQAEQVAVLEERQRIAAEMHDGLAQNLSYLEMRVDELAESVEHGRDKDALSRLGKMRQALTQAGLEVRQAIARLNEGAPLKRSLQDWLEETVKEAGAGGPPVELLIQETSPLFPARDRAEQVLRVTQEALHNARRHAEASYMTVQLQRDGQDMVLTIEDDGRGFDSQNPTVKYGSHFGLSIMRARASRLGGQLSINTAPGQGTRVVLAWPYELQEVGSSLETEP